MATEIYGALVRVDVHEEGDDASWEKAVDVINDYLSSSIDDLAEREAVCLEDRARVRVRV